MGCRTLSPNKIFLEALKEKQNNSELLWVNQKQESQSPEASPFPISPAQTLKGSQRDPKILGSLQKSP